MDRPIHDVVVRKSAEAVPVTAMPVIVRGREPVLETMRVEVILSILTRCVPKDSAVGLRVTSGPGPGVYSSALASRSPPVLAGRNDMPPATST
jgi:hypothetical protein